MPFRDPKEKNLLRVPIFWPSEPAQGDAKTSEDAVQKVCSQGVLDVQFANIQRSRHRGFWNSMRLAHVHHCRLRLFRLI